MPGQSTIAFGMFGVVVALPNIITAFGTDVQTVQWVMTSYLIARVVPMPAMGWLVSQIGQRNLYVLGVFGTTATTILCGLSWSPEESYHGAQWSRLLVVHDDSPGGNAAVHHALALAHTAALEVCLLHVNTPQQCAVDPLRVTHSAQDVMPLTEARAAIAWASPDVIWASGNTVSAIVETATAKECDVIVLGVAQCSGFQPLRSRKTAKKVMANTTIPVLLVNPLVDSWSN